MTPKITFHTKHYFIKNQWVHILSLDAIHQHHEETLFKAFNTLVFQYGKHINLCVQIGNAGGTETEKGIFIRNIEADTLTSHVAEDASEETYLITHEIYKRFSAVFENKDLELETVIHEIARNDGLIFAQCSLSADCGSTPSP